MEKFPATESTISPLHLGQFLQQEYLLSSDATSKIFRTGINHLYVVTDGKNKFVFRIYTFNWRTKLEISEELRLLIHLKECQIPVSHPIPDRNGCLIQEINAPEGTRYGVLFSFAEGKKIPKFTPQASYHVGIAMARIHQATENFELHRISYNERTLLTDSFERTRVFFTKASDEITFVESSIKYLRREYEKVKTKEVRYGSIHLDIWFDNLHFGSEDEITIFDFDFCGNGWLCYDISYFMLQLYNTNHDENEYRLKVNEFLKGYETIAKISNEEKRIIPWICISVWLFYLGVQCDRFDNWSNVFLNEDYLKRFIATIKRWIAYNNLQDQPENF